MRWAQSGWRVDCSSLGDAQEPSHSARSKRFMSKTYPGVRTRNGGATWMGHLQWTEDGKQKNVNTPAYPTEEAAARAQDK